MNIDWRDKVASYLIEAGLEGRKQSDILRTAGRSVNAAELLGHLEALRAENKVQSFDVAEKLGRPGKVWRATKLLVEN